MRYRRPIINWLTGRNENFKLERSWFGAITNVTSKRMESIRRRYGLRMVLMLRQQDQGGLSLGWREGINITLKSYSKSHIDMVVEEEDGAKNWRFTGFYGEPNGNNLPWLVAGDFNEILFSFEKQGERIREERQMDAFRKTLDDCELSDLAFPANGICGKEAGLLVIILEKDLIEVLQIQGGGNCFQILKFVIYNTVFQIISHW
ncbi:Exo_endo_phos domain-containing protein [Gossypium australe]|uniref:Exo_endo_phos domain-containing protein n=1 Tax=Gossypium australe TaxID=47621 RepID=A0A5B6VYL0_9ROSI|nr:Exo_endo_phos domain-containing protein [Gossypium australe]